MKTIDINGETYPAIAAAQLQNGMTYWDGSEIVNARTSGKTTKFTLIFDGGQVDRAVRSQSLIALSHSQVAVLIA